MIDFELLICIKFRVLEIILFRLFCDDINFWFILVFFKVESRVLIVE